jgi:hypothetical protein
MQKAESLGLSFIVDREELRIDVLTCKRKKNQW